jgi:aspartyl-tRNA(Asn)/glutamyl-tRNA(Gln) amidotransferase subunit B
MAEFEAVIGLEVHAELLTNSKIFCGSEAHFGGDPNTHVCPVCLGLPGALPVLNRRVVELAVRAALATHGEVARESKFDRKNYFYPDLPKGYQISQFNQPISQGGYVEITVDDVTRKIPLTRIHMEEDAGKLVHAGSDRLAGSAYSLVDLNRAGVPLIEVVSEPEVRSAAEARAYVAELRNIFMYAGVCDGKMEEGSLRCDANVSIRPKGSTTLGTRTEIKNLNSFRSIERAVTYEIERQTRCVEAGERIVQETRLWDENKGVTMSMRSKEEAHDYRYFPEPDLVPLVIDEAWLAEIQTQLPEMPEAKRRRYVDQLGLSAYEAGVLVDNRELMQFFEATLDAGCDAKAAANWLMGDIAAWLNDRGQALDETKLTPQSLTELVELVTAGTINRSIGKKVLNEVLETGESPKTLVDKMGVSQISDTSAIAGIIDTVIAANPKQVDEFLSGKDKVIGFLVGQVMKASQGRAKPDTVNALLKERLAALPRS